MNKDKIDRQNEKKCQCAMTLYVIRSELGLSIGKEITEKKFHLVTFIMVALRNL